MSSEPEQWAVVQEVETVTGDFLIEPGVPFYRIVIDGYCADFDHRQAAENFVAAIQRAFEEQTRELREALDPFAMVARIQGPWSAEWPDDKPNIEFIPSAWPDWGDFKRANEALATRQPTPKEGRPNDQ